MVVAYPNLGGERKVGEEGEEGGSRNLEEVEEEHWSLEVEEVLGTASKARGDDGVDVS